MVSVLFLALLNQPLQFEDYSGVYRPPVLDRSIVPESRACGWQPGADIYLRTNWAGLVRDVFSLQVTGVEFTPNTLNFFYTGAYHHHHPVVPYHHVTVPGLSCTDYFDWFGCPNPQYVYAVTGTITAERDPATEEWGNVRHYLNLDLINPAVVQHPSKGGFNVSDFTVRNGVPLYQFSILWSEVQGSPDSDLWPCHKPTEPAWLPEEPGFASFTGYRAGATPLDGQSTIRGQLVDAQQTARVMSRGRVQVYEQKTPLPLQGSMGTADYEASIRTRLRLVGTGAVGEQGRFSVNGVRLFRYVGDADTGHWHPNLVTLIISQAEVDITGLSDAVPYETLIVPNQPVFPDDGSYPQIGLTADIAFGEKRALISRLRRISNNYTPPETQMSGYLDLIEGGASPEQQEGVRRSVWAERALLEGAQSTRSVIRRLASVSGKILAEAWSFSQTFRGHDLTRGLEERGRLQAARSSLSPSQRSQFDLANIEARAADAAYSKRLTRAAESAFGSVVKEVFKLFAHMVKKVALAAGLPAGTVDPIIDGTVLVLNSLLNVMIEQTVNGGAQDVTKKIIEYTTSVLVPVLFDNDTGDVPTPFGPSHISVPFPLSYTNRTLPEVEFSVSQAQGWNQADDAVYADDVTRAARLIDAIAQNNVSTMQNSYALEAANKTGDLSETVFSLASKIPGLSGLGAVSFGSKGVKNFSLLFDAAQLELDLILTPSRVREAVYAAYGLQPSAITFVGEAPDGTSANPLLENQLAAAEEELGMALSEVDDAIAGDHVGPGVGSVLLDDGRFALAESSLDQAWKRVRSQTLAGTFSSGGNAPMDAYLKAQVAVDAVADSRAMLGDAVIALLLGVMEQTWTDVSDPAYLSARNRVRAHLAELRRKLDVERAATTELLATLDGFGTLYLPAVVVEDLETPVLDGTDQTFTVRARVKNLGVVPVADLTAGLSVVGDPGGDIEILTSSTVVVGAGQLEADDGMEAMGPDEAVVEWTVRSTRPLAAAAPHLQIDLFEGGARPVSFVSEGESVPLLSDPAGLDEDADGMPSAWESTFGLDPATPDSDGDLDGDGVDNGDEYRLGLRPDTSDTDQDGASDGEELSFGNDGFRTDPQVPDSDGDGVLDGSDLSPLDPLTSAVPVTPPEEPEIMLSSAEIILTPDMPVAVVDVRNVGGGDLYYSAVTPDPELLLVSPRSPGIAAPGTMLVLQLPLDRDVRDLLPMDTMVAVTDVSGSTRDTTTLRVLLRDEGTTTEADAGVSMMADAGTVPPQDAGSISADGGVVGPRADASTSGPGPEGGDGGCGCRAAGSTGDATLWILALGGLWLAMYGRRSRSRRGSPVP